MNVTSLSWLDLTIAATLVVALAVLSGWQALGLGRQLIVNSVRMTVQLLLVGLVLQTLFNTRMVWPVITIAMIMLLAAGREIRQRNKHKVRGFFGFGVGVMSMFVSSFSVTLLALLVIVRNDPWYEPRYAIPFLGMLLGNTMTGIALATDRLTTMFVEQREIIEQRLMLGETWMEAVADMSRDCMRTGMIPIINSMAAAGIVSLPGMMTGQILGGSSPIDAVKYQILIMFLIAAGTGFGVVAAIRLSARHLFDKRHRLRLDRLIVGE